MVQKATIKPLSQAQVFLQRGGRADKNNEHEFHDTQILI